MLTLAAAMGLTSCSDESPWEGSTTEGGINVNLTADGRVMRHTRADDGVSPVVPESSAFGIALAKSDDSYSKSWASVDAFNKEKGFPIGDYKLTATYGDLNTEGFELPCYQGVSDVHVAPGETSNVDVTATLANAMVSIRYTADFMENFSSYSAAVQTEGHDWVVFAQNEDRPAYIAPSEEVKLNITLANADGERVTVQPAGFRAQARRHYVVTIGVNGNTTSGDLALDVVFDEDVVAETIEVPLGDELWNAPAPTVKEKNFTVGTPIEVFEYAETTQNPEFHVFAYGGLRQTTLNIVTTASYFPSFGKSVDLIGSTPLIQSQLHSEGVECNGFFKNVDRLGVINVKGMLSKLPAGNYKIEVSAVDALTRVCEPTVLEVNVKTVEVELAKAANVEFQATQMTVDVNTNCPDIKDKVSFLAQDGNNRMVEAPILSVEQISGTRSAQPYTFRYTIKIDAATSQNIDVQMTLGNKKRNITVPVDVPDFTVEHDAFAKKVVIRVTAKNGNIATLMPSLKVFKGDQLVTTGIVRDNEKGLITISGLTPSTKYSDYHVDLTTSIVRNVGEFTTEADANVANGDMSATTQTINMQNVEVGGKFRVSPNDYDILTNIVRSEANGWASINAKTCRADVYQNTWFCVPSTFAENGESVIRSVGYSHNGNRPARTGGAFNTTYYCTNAPSDADLAKAAGEMFLGSYVFDTRIDQIDWTTRPSTFSFNYRYAPINDSEKAEAYLELLDAAGSVIATTNITLDAASQTQTKTVSFTGYPFGKKAAKIRLGFRSTKGAPAVHIPTGSALSEGLKVGDLTSHASDKKIPRGDNNYHAVATGSVLYIDNVRLGYDDVPAAARRRHAGK